jgi:hypothetical protein
MIDDLLIMVGVAFDASGTLSYSFLLIWDIAQAQNIVLTEKIITGITIKTIADGPLV